VPRSGPALAAVDWVSVTAVLDGAVVDSAAGVAVSDLVSDGAGAASDGVGAGTGVGGGASVHGGGTIPGSARGTIPGGDR
jgi:hypothetical protein